MSIKDIVGAERYENTRSALKKVFPDHMTVVSDALVDSAFQLAKHEFKAPDLATLPIPKPPAPPAAGAAATGFAYYVAHALHARQSAPGSMFTGELPVVRMVLPEHGDQTTLKTKRTPAGDMLPVDRLFGSVDVLWAVYGDDPILKQKKVGRPGRVDFIGAPRLGGARFAAISLYLCFAKKSDVMPTFYILEAGLATGQPRMRYLARSMDETLLANTNYLPTTFSKREHIYSAKLSMLPSGDPDTLAVKVFSGQPPAGNYMNVTVTYKKIAKPRMTNPFHLTIAAGARVQAVADALGVPSNLDMPVVLRIIAALGKDKLFTKPPK